MADDPLTGRTLDNRYEIAETIGKGGMGVVYRARQLAVDREVAVKVLKINIDDTTLSANASERFEKEARIISRLRHPNTVKLFDFGKTDDGRFYLVMELLSGTPLNKIIEEGPLTEEHTLELVRQVADSLSEAHKKGIVHRDLKPSNIFVDRVEGQEVVKVLDFGIAKSTGEPMQTATGAVIGSPAYMSPEQAQGESVDARTDVYALGILAYHCLTGKPPFEAETPVAVLVKHVTQQPTPFHELTTSVRVSPGFSQLVLRMLSKDPKDRPPDASAVKQAIAILVKPSEKGRPEESQRPLPEPPARSRMWPVIVVLFTLALAIVAFLTMDVMKNKGNAPAPRVTVSVTQLTEQPGIERKPTISPDGKFLAYESNAAGNYDIYLQRIGGNRPINLTADFKEDEGLPAFSPDGSQIAYVSNSTPAGLFVMGATGEASHQIVEGGFHPGWSHDGAEIYYSTELAPNPLDRGDESQLWAVEVQTGKKRKVFDGDAVQPDASPHGHRVAFWGHTRGQRDIWTVGVDGENPVAVTQDVPTDYNPVWSPSGDYLYFLSDRSGTMNIWRVPIEEESGKILGPYEQLTSGSTDMSDLAISHTGLMAYVNATASSTLKRVAFDAEQGEIKGEPVVVYKTSRSMTDVELSLDGRTMAYQSSPPEDISVMDRDGKNHRRLTRDDHKDRKPRFSPDGTRLAFYSNRGGDYNIWTMNIDGTGLKQLTAVKGGTYFPTWSPDGKRMVVRSKEHGLGIFDVPAGEPVRSLDPLPNSGPRSTHVWPFSWSPDGKMLVAYGSKAGGKSSSCIYSFEDQTMVELQDECYYPRWLSDSNRLLVLGDRKLVQIERKSRRQRDLIQLPQGHDFAGFTISADDSEIFYIEVQVAADLWLAQAK